MIANHLDQPKLIELVSPESHRLVSRFIKFHLETIYNQEVLQAQKKE